MLDDEIINYSCSISPEKKYDLVKNQGKLILREILKTKHLKTNGGKRGFSPNLLDFWKNFGNEIINTYLVDLQVVKKGLINKEWIFNAIFNVKEKNDIRYINKLLSVLSFEIWYRLFLSQEINCGDKLL